MKKISISTMAIALLTLGLITGCFALPVEDPVPPAPIAPVTEARLFRTIPVIRGDVVRYINAMAVYVPGREERHNFDINGLLFRGIYVNVGDYVQQGDVLASLYNPDIQNRLQAAQRREELLRLGLTQLGQRQASSQRIAAASGKSFFKRPGPHSGWRAA